MNTVSRIAVTLSLYAGVLLPAYSSVTKEDDLDAKNLSSADFNNINVEIKSVSSHGFSDYGRQDDRHSISSRGFSVSISSNGKMNIARQGFTDDGGSQSTVLSRAITHNKIEDEGVITYGPDEEWERRTETSHESDRYVALTDIEAIRENDFYYKGYLEITPDNYTQIIQLSNKHKTAFQVYNKGVWLKGWKISLGFDCLKPLLRVGLKDIQMFKIDLTWDQETDVAKPLALTLQFYKNLTTLKLRNCRLKDKELIDILKCLNVSGVPLKTLILKGNSLSVNIEETIKKRLPSLVEIRNLDAKMDTKEPEIKHEERTAPPQTIDPNNNNVEIKPKAPTSKPASGGNKARTINTISAINRLNPIVPFTPSILPTALTSIIAPENVSNLPIQPPMLSIPSISPITSPPIPTAENGFNPQTIRKKPAINFKTNSKPSVETKKAPAPAQPTRKLTNEDILDALDKVKKKTLSTQDFAAFFNSDPTLTRVDLRWDKIGDEGAKAMAEALKKNKTLTMVELGANSIGDEGAKAMADAVKENKSLTTVHLGWNKIGDEGAKAMAEALKQNKTLNKVVLGANSIGDEGAKAMADAVKENKSLTTVHLGWNKIGNEGAKAMADAVKENKTLTEINLIRNDNIGWLCRLRLDSRLKTS